MIVYVACRFKESKTDPFHWGVDIIRTHTHLCCAAGFFSGPFSCAVRNSIACANGIIVLCRVFSLVGWGPTLYTCMDNECILTYLCLANTSCRVFGSPCAGILAVVLEGGSCFSFYQLCLEVTFSMCTE